MKRPPRSLRSLPPEGTLSALGGGPARTDGSNWVDAAPLAELPPGSSKSVDVDGVMIAVFNIDGTCYAIEDVCTHDGGVLTGGTVEGDVVVCPRHGARFCVRTGRVLSPPAYEDVPTFEVRIESDVVQVRDSRWDDDAR